jgi:hypothetical protein
VLVTLLSLACQDDKEPADSGLVETGSCLSTWYIDYDGDGFGSASYTEDACAAPQGYVDNADDCDDADSAVFPTAAEVCNGLDDDCDGAVDDADDDVVGGWTWYTDADEDGFGDPTSAVVLCVQPSGTVEDFTDCDDTDPAVNPDAEEAWYDGIDSDCDGAEEPDACLDEPTTGTVAVDTTCTYTPTGSMAPTSEWALSSFSSEGSYNDVIASPAVGHLTDDNGDGFVPDGDIPDIVFVSRYNGSSTLSGALRSVSGDGNGEHFTVRAFTGPDGLTYAVYRYAAVALGDIDNDGDPEIVTTVHRSSTCYPAAFSSDGQIEWIQKTSVGCRSHAPALHDLEGDGDPEVIFGHLLLSGDDGSVLATGAGGRGYHSGYSNSGYHAFGSDLDGDGTMEWLAGSSVYAPDGSTICSTGEDDGYPSAADLDGDGEGEFVVSGNGSVRVFETDCTLMAEWSVYGGGNGGPATIADFDGDGTPEIGVAGAYYYAVYEVDGSVLWDSAVKDYSSHSTGSSVFDFDGDGAAEVVYADEVLVRIYDGATGSVILELPHDSGTINEYPVIADADGDGKAEIIVGHDGSPAGIEVIGDENDEWVSARQVWNQHAYSITNIDDDLSIPGPTSNWPTYNSFRQGAPGNHNARAATNLQALAYGACQEQCGDDVEVLIQPVNDGQIAASADLEVALYGDTGTEWVELWREALGSNLDAGAIGPVWSVVLSAEEVLLYTDLVVTIDDGGGSNECEEGDNEAWFDISGVCL